MRVEQLLHGYSDGHRLLAASKDLPRTAKHLILILSDMSGRSIVQGFEEYLTGYAVPESEYYALAKTWYATEMERPGCVWTQTLLIDAADVARLPDLSALQSLFRRPNTGSAFEHYGHPLEVSASTPVVAMPRGVTDLTLTAAVVSALYATPEAPVLVPVDNARALLDLLFAVWSQQWPHLRVAFSFCTGSISSRSIAGRPLDLQLIPYSAVREIRRELPRAALVDTDGPPRRADFCDWVATAYTALWGPRCPRGPGLVQ